MKRSDHVSQPSEWGMLFVACALGLAASACGGSTKIETPTSLTRPSATPTTDGTATAEAFWQATLQAGQTQNAAYQATSSARQTEASQARATSLALTAAPTPKPPSDSSVILQPPVDLQWKETLSLRVAAAAPFDNFRGQQLVANGNYLYVFGGVSPAERRLTDVYFSAVKEDGTLAGWVETTRLPGLYYDHVVVRAGEFVYLLTGAAGAADVYFAPLKADGTIGAWKKTASLSPSRQSFAAVAAGNFLVATGGNSGGTVDFVQVASVRPDGSLSPWRFTTPLPVPLQEHSMIAHRGHIYVFGGINASPGRRTPVYFAPLQSDGSLGEWISTTPLPHRFAGYSTFEANGYVHLVGGGATTYISQILENGELDDWQESGSLPAARNGLRAGAHNGYAYAIGGFGLGEYQDTVFYAWIGSSAVPDIPLVEHPDCTSGWSRLEAGVLARVSDSNPTPNRVRTAPDLESEMVVLLHPGHVVRVWEGPICKNGFVFWKVASQAIPGGSGWTAEGDLKEYYLEPHDP